MVKKIFLFCFILAIGGSPVSPSNLTFIFKDKESSAYPFEWTLNNIYWRGKEVCLKASGSLKQDKSLSIIEISPGSISFNSDDEEELFSLYGVLSNKILTLSYLKTRSFIVSGEVDFSKSVALNLALDVKGMNFNLLNKVWGIEGFPFQGDFRGKLNLSGNLDNIFISGSLQACAGTLEDYEFEEILLQFRGTYPWVEFFDSYLVVKGREFDIKGAFNLAKLYSLPYNNRGEAGAYASGESELASDTPAAQTSLKGFLSLSQTGGRDSFTYQLGEGSFLKFKIRQAKTSGATELEF